MLGKMEVSFEQWYHKVWWCKRPQPRICGPGEYSKIIKGGSSRYGLAHGSYC